MWVERDAAYLARVPDVPVVSTVGSGDAALAGAIRGLSLGLGSGDALRLAMACGAANAMLGEVGSVSKEDVHSAWARITIERI